jgi:hypothetical protein
MTTDQRLSEQALSDQVRGKAPLTPGKLELRRLLLEQFYEDSVDRNGPESHQVRILSRLLMPADASRAH